MNITINIETEKLVTYRGRRPFEIPKQCPICGESMRLKQMHEGTCREDPIHFEFVCSCCDTELIVEAIKHKRKETSKESN